MDNEDDSPRKPMTEDERRQRLFELLGEFVPQFAQLVPMKPSRVLPVDCARMTGGKLATLMREVGGNYGAMAELIEPDDEHVVSFGLLNVLLDVIRQQTQREQNVGNA